MVNMSGLPMLQNTTQLYEGKIYTSSNLNGSQGHYAEWEKKKNIYIYIYVCVCVCKAFSKWQKYRDGEQISGCQGSQSREMRELSLIDYEGQHDGRVLYLGNGGGYTDLCR